jgi:hypothetical protein
MAAVSRGLREARAPPPDTNRKYPDPFRVAAVSIEIIQIRGSDYRLPSYHGEQASRLVTVERGRKIAFARKRVSSPRE